MSFRSILLVLVAFAAGWASARYLAPSSSMTETTVALAPQAPRRALAPAPDAVPMAAVSQASEVPPRQASPHPPVIPSGPNRVVSPDQNLARADLVDPANREAEEKLLSDIRDRFPEARIVVRKANSDGTTVSKETLDDGGTIARRFDPSGQLVGEDWKQASGDEILRTYYDSGAIEGFSKKYANGGRTNVTFTQAGLFKARSDDFIDGSHIYTNYDDQGQVYDRWKKDKDGKSTRIQ